ncbi:MAG: chain length determinant protein tyrosine kinase EpsG [Betaproteobacteria bacterium]|nr:chain length determinant protein tyrosine kinase EpsG [Betaproteobacteria bacterium]
MNAQENVLPIKGSDRVTARQDARLGNILEENGKLDAAGVERVLELQRVEKLRFGEAALHLGLVTSDDLRGAVAKQYDFPHLLPGKGSVGAELVVAYAPFHPRAEELRALRTQVQIRWANIGIKKRMLAIASPGPAEGRSYTAANLAVAFSQLGLHTLLIDADLRMPRQHRIFNVAGGIGLSTVLTGRADSSAVVTVPEFGKLSLLPAGECPPNPQELLLRPIFDSLLEELGAAFDVILFDTPPARLYADAQSLAFRSGSVLVLARKDHTPCADTTSVISGLNDAGAQIVGTVLNAF